LIWSGPTPSAPDAGLGIDASNSGMTRAYYDIL
jgi:hypothetical protein